MDVQKKLDEIVRAIGGARSMPMSASCVVNRAELLAMLEEVRAALPGSLAQAREVIGDREQLVAEAHQEARRIIDGAHAERGTLVSSSQVARQSQDAADRILAEARREAEEIRAEADDYVDSKLANFEVVLTKTIGSVDRGREKLLGRGPGAGPDGRADADAPEYSSDPQTLIQRGDAYVDAKLGAFEAVLSKTLEAVGRGRLKLQGTPRTRSASIWRPRTRQARRARPGCTPVTRSIWPVSPSWPTRSRAARSPAAGRTAPWPTVPTGPLPGHGTPPPSPRSPCTTRGTGWHPPPRRSSRTGSSPDTDTRSPWHRASRPGTSSSPGPAIRRTPTPDIPSRATSSRTSRAMSSRTPPGRTRGARPDTRTRTPPGRSSRPSRTGSTSGSRARHWTRRVSSTPA